MPSRIICSSKWQTFVCFHKHVECIRLDENALADAVNIGKEFLTRGVVDKAAVVLKRQGTRKRIRGPEKESGDRTRNQGTGNEPGTENEIRYQKTN